MLQKGRLAAARGRARRGEERSVRSMRHSNERTRFLAARIRTRFNELIQWMIRK